MTNIIPLGGADAATMSSLDLLDIINRERVAVGESTVRRNDFHTRVADELADDHYETFVVKNPNGTLSDAYALSVDQCMLVALRESKTVRRNVLLRLKTPAAPALQEDHAGMFAALEIAARMLNASESGKLAMLHGYAKANAPALLPGLPAYAIDAPVIAGQTATSSEVTKSATALLREAGSALSARAFNALALEHGLLAKVARAGSKGVKEFLIVTDKGLRWGKNVISPQNPRESSPHWYSRSFGELLAVLN